MEEGLFLAAKPVVFTNVFLESPGSKLALFFRQPRRGPREIGKHEVGRECNHHRDGALDNEQPSPTGGTLESSGELDNITTYQANNPLVPFIPLVMPAAIRPENAPERSAPE